MSPQQVQRGVFHDNNGPGADFETVFCKNFFELVKVPGNVDHGLLHGLLRPPRVPQQTQGHGVEFALIPAVELPEERPVPIALQQRQAKGQHIILSSPHSNLRSAERGYSP